MTHLERLKRVAAEYWQPADVQLAVEWALLRILALECDIEIQGKRIVELEALAMSEAERIAKQSDLLSRRAECQQT